MQFGISAINQCGDNPLVGLGVELDTEAGDRIEMIDISDPNNPVFHAKRANLPNQDFRKVTDQHAKVRELLQIFIDVVNEAGVLGAPDGVIYTALQDKLSLAQFEQSWPCSSRPTSCAQTSYRTP